MNQQSVTTANTAKRSALVGALFVVILSVYLWQAGTELLVNRWGAVYCFASYKLLAVHVLFSLPFTWLLSGYITSKARLIAVDLSLLSAIVLSLVSSVATIALLLALPSVSATMLDIDAGFIARTAARIGLGIGLTFPFSLALHWIKPRTEVSSMALRILGVASISIYLMSVYDWKQFTLARQSFSSSSKSVRLADTLRSLSQLIELNSDIHALSENPKDPRVPAEAAQTTTPKRQLSVLQKQADELESEVASFIAQGLKTNDQGSRSVEQSLQAANRIAQSLLSLGRLDEAKQVALLLPSNQPDAQLLLAIIAREQKDWGNLINHSQSLLAGSSDGSNPLLYQLKGEALVGLKRDAEALAFYEQAFRDCDSEKADFALRIARLSMDRGDRSKAMEFLNFVQATEPTMAEEVRSHKRAILNSSCSLTPYSK